jgi:hypothetical protein
MPGRLLRTAATETRVDGRLVLLLAVACGAAVANLYYGQPLPAAIAHDLHAGSATAALLVTASQIGYAAGLPAVLALGDLLERRRRVCRLLLLTAVALLVAGRLRRGRGADGRARGPAGAVERRSARGPRGVTTARVGGREHS